MSMPIIFFTSGNPAYLFQALSQAYHTNPRNEIILIGDSSNQHYPFCTYEFIDAFRSPAAERFSQIYRHFNVSRYEFEYLCFLRWFVIFEYLKSTGAKEAVALDNDVLIFSDLERAGRRFDGKDFTLSAASSGHTMFIKNVDALGDFCSFLLETYSDPDQIKCFEDNFSKKEGQGRVRYNDMRLLELYLASDRSSIGELTEVIENSTFDHSIHLGMGFETEMGRKKLEWIENLPYGRTLKGSELTLFHTLHCQGQPGKPFMKQFTTLRQVSPS